MYNWCGALSNPTAWLASTLRISMNDQSAGLTWKIVQHSKFNSMDAQEPCL